MEVQAINGFKNLATSMHGHMMSRLRRGGVDRGRGRLGSNRGIGCQRRWFGVSYTGGQRKLVYVTKHNVGRRMQREDKCRKRYPL